MSSYRLIHKAKKTLSYERGTIFKPWGAMTTFALAYPNHYYTAMSNLGFLYIHHYLNTLSHVLCERVFLPDPEDLEIFHRTNRELFSLESQRPVKDFHILGFSLSFENDYTNMLKILQLSRIPLRKEDRNEDFPLVIAGGITCLLNPEPISDFIDLFVIGEGEEILGEFIEAFRQTKGKPREELLKDLSKLQGVYIPEFYEVKHHKDGTLMAMTPKDDFPKKICRKWSSHGSVALSSICTKNTQFQETLLLEIAKGCSRRCKFCILGHVYWPPREKSPKELKEILDGMLDKIPTHPPLLKGGWGDFQGKKVGLIGYPLPGSPLLKEICEYIVEKGVKVTLSSLRMDCLTEELLDVLKKGGLRTITLAPETATERLREAVNKKISDEYILHSVELIAKSRFSHLKLYFLIGLPGETWEDIHGIVDLVDRIRKIFFRVRQGSSQITVSVNPLIPKPSTPFQWLALERVKILEKKLEKIKNGLRGKDGIGIYHDNLRWAIIEALLARGDRQLGQLLLACHRLDGNWPKAFKELNFNLDFYLYREKELNELLPWDFLGHGLSKETLWKNSHT